MRREALGGERWVGPGPKPPLEGVPGPEVLDMGFGAERRNFFLAIGFGRPDFFGGGFRPRLGGWLG